MSISTLLFLTLIPCVSSLVIGFLIIHREDFSIRVLIVVILFSFLAILTSSILQLFTSLWISPYPKQMSFFHLLFDSFIYSGAIEEITKFLFFYCVIIFLDFSHIEKSNSTIFNSIKQKKITILVMFFASLFASFENIAYVVLNIKILPLRLITANIFHIFVAPYYLKAISKTKRINFFFTFIPIILHGAYNTFIVMGGGFLAFAFAIIFFLLISAYQEYLS